MVSKQRSKKKHPLPSPKSQSNAPVEVAKYILSKDGECRLYHHCWFEKEAGRGKLAGVVFIVHGLGEHCRRYDQLVGFLTAELNFRVYSFDHRGHGRTLNAHSSSQRQGHRGHIHTEATGIMDDIALLVERAHADGVERKVPKFLLGHSLGGLFVANYAVEQSLSALSGVILIAPALGIVNPPNIFLRKLAPIGAWLFPTVSVEGDVPVENISRLPSVIELIKADPMIHRQISFGTGNVVLQMTSRLSLSKAPLVSVPVLCIHGTADRITDCKATEDFYNRLQAPSKALYLHQDGYHRPHEDVGMDVVFGELGGWLRSTMKASK